MRKKIVKDESVTFIPKGFGFFIQECQDKEKVNKGNPCASEKQQRYHHTFKKFTSQLHDFSEIMISLLKYANQVGAVAKNTQNMRRIELYNAIRKVVECAKKKRGKPFYELVLFLEGQKSSEVIKKTYPIWDTDLVRTISELDDINGIAPKILCETVLQQIVNQWESHLANIIRITYSSDRRLLVNPIELTFEQVLSCGGLEALKRVFVDKIVSSAMRGGIDDHLRFFKEDKGFCIDLQDVFPELSALKEVMYHRDVIVHCDGVASQRHCERMRGICKEEEMPKQGERIITDLRYVSKAWDVVYAAGCIVAYMVAMRFMDGVGMRGHEDDVGGVLVEASFNALVEKRYRAVQMMIEPLLKGDCKVGGRARLAMRVNLALAYKQSGQKKKFENIVNDADWDSREENFRAIIAVLRGNFSDAYKLIKKICNDDPEYLNHVYEWVAYEDLRADKKFNANMDKIKASKSFTPHKGNYPVLEFGAAPDDVGMHLGNLFDSLLKHDSEQKKK